MTLNRFFRRALPAFLIVLCVTMETIVHAEIKTFIGVGEYTMNNFENPDIAKQRAQQNAELDAVKRAAAYLKNFSETVGATITNDEISAVATNTITFGNVQIESVANYLSGVTYNVTIEAQINTDGIEDFIRRDIKDKEKIVDIYKIRRKEIRKNDIIVESVKAQYNLANSQADKDILLNQMKTIDLKFLSNRKMQESDKFSYFGDNHSALRLITDAVKLDIQITKEYTKWSIPDFDKALELDPNNADAYRLRGVYYANLGQYAQALQDLNKAIELNSNDESAHYNRAIVYSNLKQYEQAIQDLNQAIKVYPYSDEAFAYYNRGDAYRHLKQYEQAIKDFDKAIELDPNDTNSYNLRGLCYFELKQHYLAITDFNKAIKLNPNDAALYFHRGVNYLELAKPPEGTFKNFDKSKGECALQDFTQAIKLDPNYADAYLGRGWSYSILSSYKKAIADFNKYIELVPDNAEAYRLRGYCYSELGDMEKMSADFEKYDELSGKN